MKPGGSSQKGAAFERRICEALSLWCSGGQRRDLFWRSAMSGGRATRGRKRGTRLDDQAGDICAVAAPGHVLTDQYLIECKFRRSLKLDRFMLGEGPLADFWAKAREEASEHGKRVFMVCKENRGPILALTARTDSHLITHEVTLAFVPGMNARIARFQDVVGTQCRLSSPATST